MWRKWKRISVIWVIILFIILWIINENKDYILSKINDWNKSSHDENQKMIDGIITNMKENLNKTNK